MKDKERKVRNVALSLTSMVDMFAILVIFLLTNSGSVEQWLEVGYGIQLPKAKASDSPKQMASVQINKDKLYADNKDIISVKDVLAGPIVIEPLKAWLQSLKKKDGYISIVADQDLPFGVIRRVIATSQDSGFGNVNLIVQAL